MAHPTLIYDHVGTNPIIIPERHAQHSHLTMWEHLPQPCQKGPTLTSINQCWNGSALTLSYVRNQSSMLKGSSLISDNQCQKGLALIFDTCEEPIQHACSKRLCTYIRHMRGTNPTVISDHVGTNPTVISEWPPVLD